jgi:hypothetical protein
MSTKNDGIKYMDIAEFRRLGLLQELNRTFLHPRGLALEVVQNEDGSEALGGVWDYRDDPEGMEFGPGMIDPAKVETVREMMESKRAAREKMFGSVIQPEVYP